MPVNRSQRAARAYVIDRMGCGNRSSAGQAHAINPAATGEQPNFAVQGGR